MRRFLCAAFLFLPIAAAAQTVPPPAAAHPPPVPWTAKHAAQRPDVVAVLRARFTAANTSHDGHLTLIQARAAKMTMVSENFPAIDTKNRGYVTFNDILAWRLDVTALNLARQADALRAKD